MNIMKNYRLIGQCGEEIAASYLQSLGYIILLKNFRCKLGEIDLIARDQEYLVFIEVKYRRSLNYGYPREAVNKIKQKTISKVALYYLKQHYLYNTSCRFDVVEIIEYNNEKKINLIKNAFML